MANAKTAAIAETTRVPEERIERRIYLVRSQKVMLSSDLAELYQVEPRVLAQSVKRNLERFPPDFMFQLAGPEWENLKSQFVISSWGGARRAAPYAFTEHGVAMRASVLRSPRAVQMSILVIRAFVKLRELLASQQELAARVEELEAGQQTHESLINALVGEIEAFQLDTLTREPSRQRTGF